MNDTIDAANLSRTPVSTVCFTVLDLETTGGAPPEHKITEIAAYRINHLAIAGEFVTLVDPERPIPPFITGLTGINQEMISGSPPSREVLPSLLQFIGDSVLVAHHSQFDRKFLDNELGLAHLPTLNNADLCTSRLARRILPFLPSKGLGNLAAFFGIAITDRHRAAADALATCHLLLLMLDYLKFRGLDTLEEVLLFQFNELEYSR